MRSMHSAQQTVGMDFRSEDLYICVIFFSIDADIALKLRSNLQKRVLVAYLRF